MLTKLKQAKKEWGGTLSIIDTWLDNRQALVVLYCDLAGLPPYQQQTRSLPEQEKITAFCKTLLEYTSTGHFEIYDKIILQSKLDGEENLKIAQELYSHITATTLTTLNFNDKYTKARNDQQMLDFDSDLSELGQVIESRFAREDQLLEVVHLHHTLG